MKSAPALMAIPLVLACAAQAAMEIKTPDGRRVILNDDHTWEYVENTGAKGQVVLRVVNKEDLANACRLGIRLENETTYRIRSIVPKFTVFNREGIAFETVFQAFTNIKPTQYEYQEVLFKGIPCGEVSRVTVHGADRCSVGDLTKFSPQKGECLRHIRVEPSDLISISK